MNVNYDAKSQILLFFKTVILALILGSRRAWGGLYDPNGRQTKKDNPILGSYPDLGANYLALAILSQPSERTILVEKSNPVGRKKAPFALKNAPLLITKRHVSGAIAGVNSHQRKILPCPKRLHGRSPKHSGKGLNHGH